MAIKSPACKRGLGMESLKMKNCVFIQTAWFLVYIKSWQEQKPWAYCASIVWIVCVKWKRKVRLEKMKEKSSAWENEREKFCLRKRKRKVLLEKMKEKSSAWENIKKYKKNIQILLCESLTQQCWRLFRNQ